MKKENKKESQKVIAVTINEKREMAKAGMMSSLGALFVTGFFKFKGARAIHPWAGWALLGFSLWHHLLSKPSAK